MTIFHPLFMSFYSKSVYQYVGRKWKGMCFVYLLLLLALCWIPGIIQMNSGISDFVVTEAPDIVEQIPEITIIEGEVSINRPEPYFINDPDSGTLLIIDTTGEFTSLDNADAKALLTKTKLIVEKNERETRIFDLSQVDELIVDQNIVYSWLEIIKDWAAIILYPFALLFSFLYRIIQVLIYAAIGILIAKILRITLNYQTLVSLTAVSITPVLILDTISSFMNLSIPLWNLICFFIAMGYLFFAVSANSGKGIKEINNVVP